MFRKLSAFRILFAICLLAIVGNITYQLFAHDFNSAAKSFTDAAYEFGYYKDWLESPVMPIAFIALRIVFAALFVYLCWRFYKMMSSEHYFLYAKERAHIEGLGKTMQGNYYYIKALPVPVRICLGILILLQAATFTYFLAIPYQYDEAWTYTFFSGRSIISSLTFYPLPNNHVFHNVVSGIFLLLPIDEILAIRLPNFIISFFSTYYFFKLSRKVLPDINALLATAFFSFSWPVMFYSSQGRGYGLLLFFAVLALYCFANIVDGWHGKKYFTVFVISSALGFFTVPSFLYFFVVVVLAWVAYYVFAKQWRDFPKLFKTLLAVGILTILLYAPMIGFEGLGQLTNNSSVVKHDMAFLTANFRQHLQATGVFLTSIYLPILVWVIPILLVFLLNLFRGSRLNKILSFTCLVLLISPLPLIFMHKVIPYERTWIYLLIPVALGVGMFLRDLIEIVQKVTTAKMRAGVIGYAAIAFFIIGFGVYKTLQNKSTHERDYAIDYTVRSYMRLLEGRFSSMNSIGTDTEGMAFYLAEDIKFEVYRHTRRTPIEPKSLEQGKQPNEDIVIIGKGREGNFLLNGYSEIQNDNNHYRVYLRNSPAL